eukprot:TRINITY_DN8394_c0_g1_i2.p1 TRINITY_DN8394_c0_g1~~TRINITY_DN8394_c0_g1_i2.p1  ORF type:complete len:219 (-),score=55.72 TRINITY_DN8394_c0_g1_i2:186-842(-)
MTKRSIDSVKEAALPATASSVMAGQAARAITASQTLGAWTEALGAKSPTPGGGAAAAVSAAIGLASGAMSAIYTTRKKDEESGVAEQAKELARLLNEKAARCLVVADEDAAAYAALQSTWSKTCTLTAEEKTKIQDNALAVPVDLLKLCHESAVAVTDFIPKCNPNIVSDAKVSLHLLAGAGRSAYQTALVNKPPEDVKAELKKLIDSLSTMEAKLLE